MIYEKLSHIQQEMKAPKNLRNSFGGYNYRNAEGILEAFKPYEGKYGVALVLEDEIVEVGSRVYVKANATIVDTEKEGAITVSAFAREPETKKGMDESQITGAASSYARKYALNGLFLLDDTKDPDTDEYTAKKNGMSAEEMKAQQEDAKKTEEVKSTPLPANRIEVLMGTLTKHGINAKDVYKHYGITKKSSLTYEMERVIISDLKELEKLYGSKGETA